MQLSLSKPGWQAFTLGNANNRLTQQAMLPYVRLPVLLRRTQGQTLIAQTTRDALHFGCNCAMPSGLRGSWVTSVKEQDAKRSLIHEVSQPLNVINLAVANLRNVLGDALQGDALDYLGRKLDRIEQQTERVRTILEDTRR